VRWGVGGAIAQKFAEEGFFVALTTRDEANASALAEAIRQQGGECMIAELDLVSQDSIATAFATIRCEAGDPDVLIYNAGYTEGRELPPEKELLEYITVEMFDTAQHISSRGPFLVAKEVLPAMRRKDQVFFLQQQFQLAARAQAHDRTVALLPQGHDAHAGAGAHWGILRARGARGQCGD
jgi:NAD(P)-dependent dehydrogenase (short-subunit alcohol dehydrogenase family)